MPNKSTIDLLTESFKDEMTLRRKFEIKDTQGNVTVTLYFKPITRFDRVKAQQLAGSDEALNVSTQLLCQMAEKEDGSKAFSMADMPDLQRLIPEKILNELELFLHDISLDIETAKK